MRTHRLLRCVAFATLACLVVMASSCAPAATPTPRRKPTERLATEARTTSTRIVLTATPVPPTPTRTTPPRPSPTSTPATHSTGSLKIPQTWSADLDEGVIGAGAQADIWFQAVTATERYVTPRNGAEIAVVGTSSVGLSGCWSARLSTASIPMDSLPPGTYVCVRTNERRYCQFRVNDKVGPSPGTLVIGYTTWK
jgi:hypothetical protein